MEKTSNSASLSVSVQNELTITSPELLIGAKDMGYRPELLLKRIQEHLPNPVEARLYLATGAKLRHRPSTFSTLLRELLGGDEIHEADLLARYENSARKFDKLLSDLEIAFTLILRAPIDYNGLRIGAQTAARLVIAYSDETDSFLASIVENIPDIGDLFGYKPIPSYRTSRYRDDSYVFYPAEKITGHALGFWGQVIYPEFVKEGRPYPTEFLDYFDDNEQYRHEAFASMQDVERYVDDEELIPSELKTVGGYFKLGQPSKPNSGG